MKPKNKMLVVIAGMLALAANANTQVGRGLIDPSVAPAKDLLMLPHMNAAIVKALEERRPFMSIVALNSVLLEQKLTALQAADFYGKAFVHVNLNTGSRQEIALIPGVGTRMAHELEEYRPWKTWAQFDKEIGKYVGQQETDRLKKYVFIPINLNTASDADILSIPGTGQRMLHEFKEYRPWKTKTQFDKEIGKYVGAKETARLWRYVTIP